jgi:hypothetical protein
MTIVVMLSVVVHNVIMLNVVAPTTMLGTNDILHKRRAAFFVVLCVAFLNVTECHYSESHCFVLMPIMTETSNFCWFHPASKKRQRQASQKQEFSRFGDKI